MKSPPGIVSSLDNIVLRHLYESLEALIAAVFFVVVVSCRRCYSNES